MIEIGRVSRDSAQFGKLDQHGKQFHIKRRITKQNHIEIYVGRPSLLGNPYAMKNESERDEVIAKYRVWLWERIKEKGNVYNELLSIAKLHSSGKKVLLTCYCTPKACHAEVIKRAVEWMAAQE